MMLIGTNEGGHVTLVRHRAINNGGLAYALEETLLSSAGGYAHRFVGGTNKSVAINEQNAVAGVALHHYFDLLTSGGMHRSGTDPYMSFVDRNRNSASNRVDLRMDFGGFLVQMGANNYSSMTNAFWVRPGSGNGSPLIELNADVVQVRNSLSVLGALTGDGSGLTALNASNLGSGIVPTARLGSGTANSTTFLRGDNTWQTVSSGSQTPWTSDINGGGFSLTNVNNLTVTNTLTVPTIETDSLQVNGGIPYTLLSDIAGANELLGWDASGEPARFTAGAGIAISGGEITVTTTGDGFPLLEDGDGGGFSITNLNSVTLTNALNTPTLNVGTLNLTNRLSAAVLPVSVETFQITLNLDGGGSVISTGQKGYTRVPYSGTITGVEVVADQTGSIVVDVWKDTYANYPPTDADSITASAPPTLSSAIKSQNTTLTGWTTAITAGDYIGWNVDSAATVTRVQVNIYGTKN
jgi:hypothetical protein